MTTDGADMNRVADPENVFRALKPAALDSLADDGYSRHRAGDLSRITATSQGHRSGLRRRPAITLRIVAGAATAACVAGAIVVVTAGHDRHQPGATPVPVTAAPTIDARTFLLASAQTAAKAPATTGNYWYTKSRTTQWTNEAFSLENTKSADKRKSTTKTLHLSSLGTIASTEESWIGRGPSARTITGVDTQITVPPADKAAWKAFGPATLNPGLPVTRTVNNYTMQMHFQIGNQQVTLVELAQLPTNVKGLEAELWRRYKIDRADPKEKAQLAQLKDAQPASYADMVWWTAQDLLAGPITPGTRAALYQLLAQQPGIKAVGTVTDTLGRKGVALTMDGDVKRFVPGVGPASTEERLIIDSTSAQLLAHETYPLGPDGKVGHIAQSDAVQAMGWTDQIDQRP